MASKNNFESRELRLCEFWVLSILEAGETTEALFDIMTIKDGDKKCLLRHMEALHDILGEGIKQLTPMVEKEDKHA